MTDPPPIDASGQANQPFTSSSTHGHGHGHGCAGATHAEKIPKIQWDNKDLNIHTHIAWLISWCKTYPNTCMTLFSDSHQDMVNEGQRCQQMSTQKEVYYQQVAEAVFMHDHDAHIRHLHFGLHKKYNEANKTLGATGVGLTSAELQEHPDMKKLLDKIIANFPWWEDLHGFWRTNPSYNMQGTTTSESLPMVGNGWVSSKPSPAIEDDSPEAEEGEDVEEIHRDDMLSFSKAVLDENINPQLHSYSYQSPPPPLIPQSVLCPLPPPSTAGFQPGLVDANTLPTTGVLNTLSSHTWQASTGTGISVDWDDKGKSPAGVNSTSLIVPSCVPSSSGSSAVCKQSRDVTSEVSTKLTKTSDSLICQIQNSAEANSQTKQMKIQALVIAKELKACNKNAQHEHDLKLKMAENDHELSMAESDHNLSMATEKTKQLELELELERVRLA
ncbi:hypothetical protein F5141DRAFT_1247643 [Pisolithus sp. B1]|nr:hypothetical protein F5141DRAFT_1247643 [Pisolithus sp. B1]